MPILVSQNTYEWYREADAPSPGANVADQCSLDTAATERPHAADVRSVLAALQRVLVGAGVARGAADVYHKHLAGVGMRSVAALLHGSDERMAPLQGGIGKIYTGRPACGNGT